LAFATRTASVLVDGFCFGRGAFVNFPPIGVGAFEARPTGCVLIGPVTGLPLGMLDNWIRPNSFKGRWPAPNRARVPTKPLCRLDETALQQRQAIALRLANSLEAKR
jgi:hypothetical protein